MKGAPQSVRERALKLATGELAGACGGQEAAGSIIEKTQQHVQRCASAAHDRDFLNLRDVALLEAHAPEPVVTKLLAKLAGGVFLPLPDPSAAQDGELPMQVIQLADELGDVSHVVREALRDGAVSPAELAAIERELDQLVERAVEARAMVQILQGNEPTVVSLLRGKGRA